MALRFYLRGYNRPRYCRALTRIDCRSRILKAVRLELTADAGANSEMNVAASSETNSSICLAEQCRIAAPVTANPCPDNPYPIRQMNISAAPLPDRQLPSADREPQARVLDEVY
jgi:hypothetical protein